MKYFIASIVLYFSKKTKMLVSIEGHHLVAYFNHQAPLLLCFNKNNASFSLRKLPVTDNLAKTLVELQQAVVYEIVYFMKNSNKFDEGIFLVQRFLTWGAGKGDI